MFLPVSQNTQNTKNIEETRAYVHIQIAIRIHDQFIRGSRTSVIAIRSNSQLFSFDKSLF
jgi:hypothetical protein